MHKFLFSKLLAIMFASVFAVDANAITETYSFTQWAKDGYTFTMGESYPAITAANIAVSMTNGENVIPLNGRFAFRQNAGRAWDVRKGKYDGLYCYGAAQLAIRNLKVGDELTISAANYPDGGTFVSTIVSLDGTQAVSAGDIIGNGTTYKVIADGDLIISGVQYYSISEVIIEAAEMASMPLFNVRPSNTSRILTIDPGVSSIGTPQTAYYTLDGTEPTNESTLVDGPITLTETTTVKAVAYAGSLKSEVNTQEIEAGTIVYVNAPSMVVTGVSYYKDDFFLATLGATYDNTGVMATPTSVITATFNGEDVSTEVNDGTFSPTAYADLTITASAEGYGSASTTVKVSNLFTRDWLSTNYSTLSAEQAISLFGDGWDVLTGTLAGRWANWNRDNAYEFIGFNGGASGDPMTIEDRLRMRQVVILNVGYGLGRNIEGSEVVNVLGTKPGQIVKTDIYSGLGNYDADTYDSYYYMAKESTLSFNLRGGTTLVQAAIFSPIQTSQTYTATGEDGSVIEFVVTDAEKMTCTITKMPFDGSGSLTIPSEILGYHVTSILIGAIENINALTSIDIPATITELPEACFQACTELRDVTVHWETPIVIPEDCFYQSTIVEGTLHVPAEYAEAYNGASVWGDFFSHFEYQGLYYHITSFSERTVELIGRHQGYQGEVIIPETAYHLGIGYTVTSIASFAFADCILLIKVIFPDSVETIGEYVFSGCTGLTYIHLPTGLVYIGGGCFTGCTSLHFSTFVVEEGVEIIGSDLFGYTTAGGYEDITAISLPKTLKSIGEYAFAGCFNLVTVLSHITDLFAIADNVFPQAAYENATLIVPDGTKSLYESTPGWKNFRKIVELSTVGIANISVTDNDSGHVFTLGGLQAKDAKKRGVYIMDGKKVVVK